MKNKLLSITQKSGEKKQSMYELREAEELQEAIAEGGDQTEKEKAILAKVKADIKKKGIGYLNAIKIKNDEIEYLEFKIKKSLSEIEEKRKRIKGKTQLISKLSDTIMEVMESEGMPEIETAEFVAKIKKNPPKIIETSEYDVNKIDQKYIDCEIIKNIIVDKKAIKAVLVKNRENPDFNGIAGFKLEQTKQLKLK